MPTHRQLHLAVFIRPVGVHTGTWRYPAANLPEGLDDIVDKVVPELQRLGLFRRDYPGTRLRETLELPRLVNRFFSL